MARIAAKMNRVTELSMEQEPYRNFIDSLDSEVTKRCYQDYISYFMNFVRAERYEDLLTLDENPHKLEGIIRDYIIHMRQYKKLSSATISARIAGVSHFYQMNDVIVNWRKLKKFRGKHHAVIEDRPYTRDEIKRLLDFAPLRDKAMILLMASSGMRRGALPCLRLKDMEKIEEYNLLKFRVYRTDQESYITFCTPECTELIHQYLGWREKLGERLTPDTPLFRKEFDAITQVHRPSPIGAEGIARAVNRLLDDSQVQYQQVAALR